MNKRFIAGAVCPSCSEMDKLFMYREDGRSVRECVRCGFKDVIDNDHEPDELHTRVNQPIEEKNPLVTDDDVQIVRIMPGGLGDKKH